MVVINEGDNYDSCDGFDIIFKQLVQDTGNWFSCVNSVKIDDINNPLVYKTRKLQCCRGGTFKQTKGKGKLKRM